MKTRSSKQVYQIQFMDKHRHYRLVDGKVYKNLDKAHRVAVENYPDWAWNHRVLHLKLS